MNDRERPGFLIYREAAAQLEILPDADAGAVIKATARLFLKGELPDADDSLTPIQRIVFEGIRSALQRDATRYDEVCQKRAEAAAKRWNGETPNA
ncbi:MAG: DUF6291 domain-containing protein [Eubacteriales bacterium]|nr:DUF6291 domain-containing protein [Eubacteriales bacterium]